MKEGAKVLGFFVFSAIVLAAIGIYIERQDRKVLAQVEETLSDSAHRAKEVSYFRGQIYTLNSQIRKFLFETIDQVPQEKARMRANIESIVRELKGLKSYLSDTVKLERKIKGQGPAGFRKIERKIEAMLPLIDRVFSKYEEDKSEACEFYNNNLAGLLKEAENLAGKTGESSREEAALRTRQLRDRFRSENLWTLVITGAGLVLVFLFFQLAGGRSTFAFRDRKDDSFHKIKESLMKNSNPIPNVKRPVKSAGEGLFFKSHISQNKEEGASLRKEESSQGSEQGEQSEAAQKVAESQDTEMSSMSRQLEQRARQAHCLYGLSKMAEQRDKSLEEILYGTVDLVQQAYQNPEQICVRILFDGIVYQKEGFRKSEVSQSCAINVEGKKSGTIYAYYTGNKPSDAESVFLKEEWELIQAVAEHLGSIAENKKGGEKLRLFRNLVDRSNDSIFVVEPRWGRMLDVNERACEALGYSRGELLDMTVEEIEEFLSDSIKWQEIVEELNEKKDIVIEGRHKRKDKGGFFAETSFKLVERGKEDYILAISRDITERKQAEEKQQQLIDELRDTNKRVKQINDELKDFAYVVSHDLKAPLRGIKTLADWICNDYSEKLDETGREQLNLLMSRVDRMHNLIEGILKYSRVGREKEQKVSVDLNELLTEVIDMVSAPESVEIEVQENLPVIRCERTSIIRVFENLLSNSIKYMDKSEGVIRIGCEQEQGYWKLSVSDNGPGIEKKHFDRIFKIFQTLSSRDEFESTGVGLTVVKKIVELQGGKIWLRSEVGEGTTFYFTVPKEEGKRDDAQVQAPAAC